MKFISRIFNFPFLMRGLMKEKKKAFKFSFHINNNLKFSDYLHKLQDWLNKIKKKINSILIFRDRKMNL